MTGSPGRILLDTTVVIAAFRRDASIRQRLASVQSVVTTTVLGELYYGAHRAQRSAQQFALIFQLITTSTVLDCDQRTAEDYGRVKHALDRQGTPIPENDIWIAASALQHGLSLATRDGHFNSVPGLIVEQW